MRSCVSSPRRGYTSFRQLRGSAGWAFGVGSSTRLWYGATNGSGAATIANEPRRARVAGGNAARVLRRVLNVDTGSVGPPTFDLLQMLYPDRLLFCGVWSPDGARLACEGGTRVAPGAAGSRGRWKMLPELLRSGALLVVMRLVP
jgi:hypothetical protein